VAEVIFEGLEELREQLRNLPADLTADATEIVTGAAEAARFEIVRAYPKRTGNLRNHVVLATRDTGKFGAGVALKNTAKHAYLFEVGTMARHSKLGANRGSMPAGKVFVPLVIYHRRAMYRQLKSMLAEHGLTVFGDATA
jgi:hypothetical protein